MNRSFVILDLINEFEERQDLNTLAFFYLLKSNHSHGWFRTQSKVAITLNLSRKTVNQYIQRLIKYGLITKINGYYKLATTNDLTTLYGINRVKRVNTIILHKNDSISTVKSLLRLKIVERLYDQQVYHINNRNNSIKLSKRKKDYDHKGRSLSAINERFRTDYKCLDKNVAFTYEYLANVFNTSKSQTFNTIKSLEKRGLLVTEVLTDVILTVKSYNEYKSLIPELSKQYSNHRYFKGEVLRNIATGYKINKYYSI